MISLDTLFFNFPFNFLAPFERVICLQSQLPTWWFVKFIPLGKWSSLVLISATERILTTGILHKKLISWSSYSCDYKWSDICRNWIVCWRFLSSEHFFREKESTTLSTMNVSYLGTLKKVWHLLEDDTATVISPNKGPQKLTSLAAFLS